MHMVYFHDIPLNTIFKRSTHKPQGPRFLIVIQPPRVHYPHAERSVIKVIPTPLSLPQWPLIVSISSGLTSSAFPRVSGCQD